MRTMSRTALHSHLEAAEAGGVDRIPIPGPPPLHGAQWDEVRGVWMRWMDDTWLVVEEHADGPHLGAPIEDIVIPAALAYDLAVAHELDLRHPEVVIDLTSPEPTVRVPHAQWNELAARWEAFDAATESWVPVAAPA